MARGTQPTDGFSRWAQLSGRSDVLLVRLVASTGGNTYLAEAVEFDVDGLTQPVLDEPLSVINVAEPAAGAGQMVAGSEAVALDVEGRWIVCLHPPASASFVARVSAKLGAGRYAVIEQSASSQQGLIDRSGAAALTAENLAELAVGSGQAMDLNSRVLVTSMVEDGSPPSLRYVFDHPVYAKYLD